MLLRPADKRILRPINKKLRAEADALRDLIDFYGKTGFVSRSGIWLKNALFHRLIIK